MKKIKVAFVAGGLTTGGVESVIYNYVSHIESRNYEWFYISYDIPDRNVRKRFEELGFHIYVVTKKKENIFKSCREVYEILKKNKIQIVHSHMTLMCFITNILGKMAGAEVLISHSHLALHQRGVKRIIYAIFKCLSKWTATDYFACGYEAGCYLYGKRMMESGRVIILNNALDYDRFRFCSEVRERVRTDWGLQDKYVIGHVGRFSEQKNHYFLLRIFAKYKKVNENSHLVLVGDGPLMVQMKEEAKQLGITDAVLFVGPTDKTEECYMAMDLFLFPSLYEGLSVAALEAQIAGLPVLASDTVARETALTGNMHFLSLDSPSKEWVQEIDRLCGKRVEKGIRKRLQAKELDISREAQKLDSYYQAMVRRKK